MMASPRENILERLRAAPKQVVAAPDVTGFYDQRPREDLPTRVERLALNLTNAMAEVHRTTPAGLPAALAALIQDKSFRRVAVGNEVLACQALCDDLQNVCALHPVQTPHAEQVALFTEMDAGITLSSAAIAETGTIVLKSSPDAPRLLSLVPPVHIVIVDAKHVVDTLFDLIHQECWSQGMPTNVILVSSPSKTADIQQVLAYGAHGPKQLIVMLVEDR